MENAQDDNNTRNNSEGDFPKENSIEENNKIQNGVSENKKFLKLNDKKLHSIIKNFHEKSNIFYKDLRYQYSILFGEIIGLLFLLYYLLYVQNLSALLSAGKEIQNLEWCLIIGLIFTILSTMLWFIIPRGEEFYKRLEDIKRINDYLRDLESTIKEFANAAENDVIEPFFDYKAEVQKLNEFLAQLRRIHDVPFNKYELFKKVKEYLEYFKNSSSLYELLLNASEILNENNLNEAGRLLWQSWEILSKFNRSSYNPYLAAHNVPLRWNQGGDASEDLLLKPDPYLVKKYNALVKIMAEKGSKRQ